MANDGYEKEILAALGEVRGPDGKDLVAAKLVTAIQGAGRTLQLSCRDPGWPPPVRQRIEQEIDARVRSRLPDLEPVAVRWESAASAGQAAPGTEGLSVGHVVAVGSGKGGVGKSTIAASLAYALVHRGLRVGLMDADVYGPSIPHMLGLAGQPAISAEGRYIPPVTDGIKVISMGFLVPANQAVVWRGPMLHKAVRDFLFLVEWGPLDYLIVDLPPGTGDIVLSLSQNVPMTGGVIVCTPQDVALLDARKALNMLGTVKVPCLGIVENMSFFECPQCGSRIEIFGHGGAEAWAKEAGIPFLGHVPINLQVRINGDQGRLRDNFADDNPVRSELLQLAGRLIEQAERRRPARRPSLEIV